MKLCAFFIGLIIVFQFLMYDYVVLLYLKTSPHAADPNAKINALGWGEWMVWRE